jgi:hypothetical protein
VVDYSYYCLFIEKNYVPSYMSEIYNYLNQQSEESKESESVSHCFNLNLTIKSAGKIKCLSSRNQEIDYELSEDGTIAKVSLHGGSSSLD